MDKTIKEIADEHLISKQAVRAHLKKLPPSYYQVDSNGTIKINEEGQKALDSELSTKKPKVDTKVDTNLLKSQVATLTQVITAQNAEIDRLTHLLDQQQKLHLLDKQKLAQTEEKLLLLEAKDKKKWWQFWKADDQDKSET